MAHYARVNSTTKMVTFVTPLDNDIITDENGVEQDELARTHLYDTIPDSVGDTWIKTSYNNNIRVRYAGIGYTYNETLDAFVPPKPYPSWTLNNTTANWDPPVPMPTPSEENPSYSWDEELQNWVPGY